MNTFKKIFLLSTLFVGSGLHGNLCAMQNGMDEETEIISFGSSASSASEQDVDNYGYGDVQLRMTRGVPYVTFEHTSGNPVTIYKPLHCQNWRFSYNSYLRNDSCEHKYLQKCAEQCLKEYCLNNGTNIDEIFGFQASLENSENSTVQYRVTFKYPGQEYGLTIVKPAGKVWQSCKNNKPSFRLAKSNNRLHEYFITTAQALVDSHNPAQSELDFIPWASSGQIPAADLLPERSKRAREENDAIIPIPQNDEQSEEEPSQRPLKRRCLEFVQSHRTVLLTGTALVIAGVLYATYPEFAAMVNSGYAGVCSVFASFGQAVNPSDLADINEQLQALRSTVGAQGQTIQELISRGYVTPEQLQVVNTVIESQGQGLATLTSTVSTNSQSIAAMGQQVANFASHAGQGSVEYVQSPNATVWGCIGGIFQPATYRGMCSLFNF